MSSLKKKCQVVLLHSTANTAKFGTFDTIYNDNGIDKHKTVLRQFKESLPVGDIMAASYKPANLYVLSDEEIKEGDWIYTNHIIKQIIQVKGFRKSKNDNDVILAFDNNLKEVWLSKSKKVLATTDSSLTVTTFYEIEGNQQLNLPQPSSQFITKFIEEYNKGVLISEVLVEYEEY